MAGPHASLLTLLRCLDRDDVLSLRLAAGEVATATRAQGVVPLTQAPLSAAQVDALLQHTAMAQAAASAGAQEIELETTVDGRALRVVLSRLGGQLQIRFQRPSAQATAAVAPTAASAQASPTANPTRRDGIDILKRPPPPPPPPQVAPVAPVAQPDSAPSPQVLQPEPGPTRMPSPLFAPQLAVAPAPTPRPTPAPLGHSGPPELAPASALGREAALQALGSMVAHARSLGASDLHLAGQGTCRLRCGGKLTTHGEPLNADDLHAMGLALLTPAQQQLMVAQGYIDLALDLPEGGRVRANMSRHPLGLKICLRLVANEVPTLASLGLPDDLAAVAKYHQGLAIVSGPSGHGKSSTLAALIDLINGHSAHHIITVEDPIEVVHPVRQAVISQREVGPHTTSYARALKAALRQDPDVIVIGELRDRETVEIALTAAETGHLVIATMNTRSAAKTIDRLIDLFPPEDQAQVRATLAGSLKMVISQRLIPSVTGPMVAAVELLTGNVPLWALIRDNKLVQLPSLQQRGRSAGMIRLDTSLLALVKAGTITADAARVYVENAVEFERLLKEP